MVPITPPTEYRMMSSRTTSSATFSLTTPSSTNM